MCIAVQYLDSISWETGPTQASEDHACDDAQVVQSENSRSRVTPHLHPMMSCLAIWEWHKTRKFQSFYLLYKPPQALHSLKSNDRIKWNTISILVQQSYAKSTQIPWATAALKKQMDHHNNCRGNLTQAYMWHINVIV